MSLQSIRESYSRLLETFKDAGFKLTESQKANFDGFILALESTMSRQRRQAIRLTKKAVEKRMQDQYRKVFESIMANTAENARLASKIQDKITKINESKKLARKVDGYLNLYVESVLPKKSIVDYDRLRKLENLQESLTEALEVNNEKLQERKRRLEESYKARKSKLETEVAKMQVKLNESMSKTRKLQKKVDDYKAMALLEAKTRDLPAFEAGKVKKLLAEATAEEIDRKFSRVLESVKRDVKQAASECDTTLESEIQNIVDSDDETVECGDAENGTETDEADEDFETTEDVKFDTDGNVQLDDDDVIDQQTINEMCRLCRDLN